MWQEQSVGVGSGGDAGWIVQDLGGHLALTLNEMEPTQGFE